MVAGGLLLLIAGFMFFVEDDEANVAERSEERAAGAEDDTGSAIADFLPVLKSLDGRLLAVEDGDSGSEAFA